MMPPSSSDITHDESDKGLTGRRGDILTSYNQSVEKRRPAGHTSFKVSEDNHQIFCIITLDIQNSVALKGKPTSKLYTCYIPAYLICQPPQLTPLLGSSLGAETHKYTRLIGPATKGTRENSFDNELKVETGRKPAL